MLIQILLTLFVIIAFIYIYKRWKTDNEEFLILKLIGYYLIGCFRFNFNNMALPAGFIVYLLLLKPKINKTAKKAATYLGLFIFFCGLFFPIFQESYFERQREVVPSSTNIYTINLYSDLNAIKQKLDIQESTKIENFDASFENSGAIKELRYKLLTWGNEGVVLYNVNFSSSKGKYTIKPTKVKEYLQYHRLISEEQFFYALGHLNLKQARPQEEYPFYTISCNGDYASWGVKDWENFLITENEVIRVKNEELPIGGYVFLISGYKRISEHSSVTDNNKAYILPIQR